MSEAITIWIVVRCLEPKAPTATVRDLQSLAISFEEVVSLEALSKIGGVIEVEKVIVDHTPVAH
jgi:hypothetical protein